MHFNHLFAGSLMHRFNGAVMLFAPPEGPLMSGNVCQCTSQLLRSSVRSLRFIREALKDQFACRRRKKEKNQVDVTLH